MTLMPVDPSNALAVSDYLTKARDWLATCVEMTGPEQIAAAKAEIATAAEATKQLGLSKEIQLDAQEMVRRAEYALGKAIRKGQDEGTVYAVGKNPHPSSQGEEGLQDKSFSGVPVTTFGTNAEIYGNPSLDRPGLVTLADSAPDPATFDAALAEAKEEGNVSRANVVRKIKKQECDRGPSRADKAEVIRDLAAKGYTSEQMCKEVGYARGDAVRDLAREYDIAIPADAVRLGRRRFNHGRVLDNVTEAVEVAAMSLRDVDPAQLDREEALERLDSLTTSINALARAVKKIKESFHE